MHERRTDEDECGLLGHGSDKSLSLQVQTLRLQMESLARQISEQEENSTDPEAVREVLKARDLRNKFFNSDLFADPAWDILLKLYRTRLEHSRISVSALCLAAEGPSTTNLRWIHKLERRGLVVRRKDQFDGRRVWVQLSSEGLRAMKGYFSARAGKVLTIYD